MDILAIFNQALGCLRQFVIKKSLQMLIHPCKLNKGDTFCAKYFETLPSMLSELCF